LSKEDIGRHVLDVFATEAEQCSIGGVQKDGREGIPTRFGDSWISGQVKTLQFVVTDQGLCKYCCTFIVSFTTTKVNFIDAGVVVSK